MSQPGHSHLEPDSGAPAFNRVESRRAIRGHRINGAKLRELRAAAGQSQEHIANQACLSERLIRKAESGGSIDAHSVARLARVYSSAHLPLAPRDLLLPAGRFTASAETPTSLLWQWLSGLWGPMPPSILTTLASKRIRFHCDCGTLAGHAALRRRAEHLQRTFANPRLELSHIVEQPPSTAARWSLTVTQSAPSHGVAPAAEPVAISGSLFLRLSRGKVAEAWEYRCPDVTFQRLRAGTARPPA